MVGTWVFRSRRRARRGWERRCRWTRRLYCSRDLGAARRPVGTFWLRRCRTRTRRGSGERLWPALVNGDHLEGKVRLRGRCRSNVRGPESVFHGSLTDGVWDTGCCGRVVHVFYDAMTFVRLSPASTVSLCMAWIDRGGEREARARSGGPEKGIDRADWAFLSRGGFRSCNERQGGRSCC